MFSVCSCFVLNCCTDSSRTIAIPLVNHATRTAHILELDSDTFHLDSPGGAWPEGLPHIDGVLVCYDASDLASFARVPELLGTFRSSRACRDTQFNTNSLLPRLASFRRRHGLQMRPGKEGSTTPRLRPSRALQRWPRRSHPRNGDRQEEDA